MVFWIALRSATDGSVRLRFFLLTSFALNLFAGTGYFFFSGVTNFGDWAAVIAGLHAHWLWRALLVVAGMASYYGAVLVVGTGLVRYVGVPRNAPPSAAETHVHSLLLVGTPFKRGWTFESDWNPAGVAIRSARSGGRALRASVVEVLHSERNRSRATVRCH